MNIVMLGQSGFPYGMATIQKMKLIAEGLAFHGNRVTVMNRLPVHPAKEPFLSLKPEGNINGVDYIYTSGTPIRPESFTKRNIIRLLSYFKEFHALQRIQRQEKIEVVIIYETYILDLIYYYILSIFFRYRLYLHYVELRSKVRGKGIIERINNHLFDRFAFNFLHGNLPISHFLEDYSAKRKPGIPQFRVPTLVNFALFDSVEKKDENYLLFCGSSDYYDIYKLIISAYDAADLKDTKLFLVAGGTQGGLKKVQELIKDSIKSFNIQLYSRIEYSELIRLYCNATALIIPLRNTPQDIARFPHKIGEYSASSKAIITTKIGELSFFFSHLTNAYFAKGYSISEFAEAFREVTTNKEIRERIGEGAYMTGKKNFCHISAIEGLQNFLYQQLGHEKHHSENQV